MKEKISHFRLRAKNNELIIIPNRDATIEFRDQHIILNDQNIIELEKYDLIEEIIITDNELGKTIRIKYQQE